MIEKYKSKFKESGYQYKVGDTIAFYLQTTDINSYEKLKVGKITKYTSAIATRGYPAESAYKVKTIDKFGRVIECEILESFVEFKL